MVRRGKKPTTSSSYIYKKRQRNELNCLPLHLVRSKRSIHSITMCACVRVAISNEQSHKNWWIHQCGRERVSLTKAEQTPSRRDNKRASERKVNVPLLPWLSDGNEWESDGNRTITKPPHQTKEREKSVNNWISSRRQRMKLAQLKRVQQHKNAIIYLWWQQNVKSD